MLRIFLIATLCLFFTSGNSQEPWPSATSEWCVELGPPAVSFYDYLQYSVDGTLDTLGRECTRLMREGVAVLSDTILRGTSFKYLNFNGDTLFWLVEGQFRPLLCFNLEVGDTWFPLPADAPPESQCPEAPMEVVAKNTVEYNGVEYRQISVAPVEAGSEVEGYFHWSGTFDERTFGRNQFFPVYNQCIGVPDFPFYSFGCYQDDEISIEDCDLHCDASVSIPELAGLTDEVKIFPNPLKTGETLRVDGIDKVEYMKVFNSTGELVQSVSRIGTFLEIDLSEGLYFLKIESKAGYISTHRLLIID